MFEMFSSAVRIKKSLSEISKSINESEPYSLFSELEKKDWDNVDTLIAF